MNKLVSIIIPYYNRKKELLLSLESIKKQTYQTIEVIVVDDGSKCKIKNLECRMPIKIIEQKHAGAPVARNRGLQEAKGEYVIFWDADVVAEPNMLETMVKKLEENFMASFAYCNFYLGWKKMKGQNFKIERLKDCNYINSTTLIRKKDVIKWDESLKRFQDWDYFLTLAEQGKNGVWIDQYLFRAITGGTMSSWLPSFAYKKPWCFLPGISRRVKKYQEAKMVVQRKHGIGPNLNN